jgi:hypothetical protein
LVLLLLLLFPTGGMDVCLMWVLSGRGLCDELITRPEESYRLWCFVVWSRNLVNEEALAHCWGCRAKQTKQTIIIIIIFWVVIILTLYSEASTVCYVFMLRVNGVLTSSSTDYRSLSIIDRQKFPWITINYNRLLPRTIYYYRTG